MFARNSYISSGKISMIPAGQETKNDTKTSSKSLGGLEEALRGDAKEKNNVVDAPAATQHSTSRHEQIRSSLNYGNDDMYQKYHNYLADYSNITKQTQGTASEVERALTLSTLNSKKELSKLQQTNDNNRMLSTSFGLHSASERQYKLAKKPGNHVWKNSTVMN
jgi:hypothetical protein